MLTKTLPVKVYEKCSKCAKSMDASGIKPRYTHWVPGIGFMCSSCEGARITSLVNRITPIFRHKRKWVIEFLNDMSDYIARMSLTTGHTLEEVELNVAFEVYQQERYDQVLGNKDPGFRLSSDELDRLCSKDLILSESKPVPAVTEEELSKIFSE